MEQAIKVLAKGTSFVQVGVQIEEDSERMAEDDAVKLADDGPWIWRGPITGRPIGQRPAVTQ